MERKNKKIKVTAVIVYLKNNNRYENKAQRNDTERKIGGTASAIIVAEIRMENSARNVHNRLLSASCIV